MSAVMSTLSIISGGRRAHRKLHTSSRKSGQYSDAGDDRIRSNHDLKQQRSASLQTLETTTQNGGVVNLESLEAKMASIEVSLASSRRRSVAREHGRELDALRSSLQDKDALIQSLKTQLSASLSAARLAAQATSPMSPRPGSRDGVGPLSADERRALEERAEAVRADLDARKNNINDLRRRLEKTHVTENIDSRIQQAELQYKLGREELELLSLSEQARVLQALIQHADHSTTISLYSAVRDCGGVASLVSTEAREGSWGAAPRNGHGLYVEWARDHTVLKPGDRLVEVNGISMLSSHSQDELQKALSAAPALAQLVLMRPQLLAQHTAPTSPMALTQAEAASLRSELGVLRAAAEEAERAKRGLRADNTRLTHRISYLEEQVAEMLADHAKANQKSNNDNCLKSTVNKCKKNITNISITSEPTRAAGKPDVQVFQKGPDITALVANLPGLEPRATPPSRRPRSDASGASCPRHTSPQASPGPRRALSSHADHRAARMRHSLSHHCIHAADYRTETDAALRLIERNQRHIEKHRPKDRLSRCASDERFRSDSDLDVDQDLRHEQIQKAADRIEDSIKKTNWAERKTLSIIEQLKKSQRLRKMKKNESAEEVRREAERHPAPDRIDGKLLENAHKSTRRLSRLYARSAKSSEFESECSDYPAADRYCSSPRVDCGSEPARHHKHEDRPDGEAKSRPTPPRKPLRLSLHKARSAHSLVTGSESESASPRLSAPDVAWDGPHKKPVKRTHAADRWTKPSGKATPRPARRLLNGLSEAPAADHLYPDTHAQLHNGLVPGNTARWC